MSSRSGEPAEHGGNSLKRHRRTCEERGPRIEPDYLAVEQDEQSSLRSD